MKILSDTDKVNIIGAIRIGHSVILQITMNRGGLNIQTFIAILKKPENKGGLTTINLPFNAAEVFNLKKGPIRVCGTINSQEYRNKLIPRGHGLYIMAIDKKLQSKIGFCREDMEVEISMNLDESAINRLGECVNIESTSCDMDVLTAIKTRQSVRVFSLEEIEDYKINTILEAGFCAPTAKNKRPGHFILTKNKDFILHISDSNNHKAFLTANCCIVVCGDKNVQGISEFLIEDCAASVENILLAAHGLKLGATWCGLLRTCPSYKYICDYFSLPDKIIPIALIALGYPAEQKIPSPRYDKTKIHLEKW